MFSAKVAAHRRFCGRPCAYIGRGRVGPPHRLDILAVADLAELELGAPFGFVWASPPCTAFSVAAMGKNWERAADRRSIKGPKHPRAEMGMRIASHTFALIDAYVARHPGIRYAVENPIGALRVMPFAVGRTDHRWTWYCQWDDRRPGQTLPRAKPTDIWTNLVGEWPTCRAGAPDHEAAPRGARTGVQGQKDARTRSLVPGKLSLAVCLAAETDGVLRPELAGASPAQPWLIG